MTKYSRKIDTRNKIELGGLVIKSKLSYLQEHNKNLDINNTNIKIVNISAYFL